MTTTHWTLTHDAKGVAWLSLDVAGHSTNILSKTVIAELVQVLDGLDKKPPKGLIFLSGKKAGFIAGADIEEFSTLTTKEAAYGLVQRGWDLMERIAALPYPTLALIHGHCLGGGLELALACRMRVAVDQPSTRLGLPEVLLGIVPGWGGMTRLPRLIDAPMALDLMLTGRTIDANRARKMGVVDYAVPERVAKITAQAVVLKGVAAAKGWLAMRRRLLNGLLKPLIARQARQSVARKAPEQYYPAPYALIDIWSKANGNALARPESLYRLIEHSTTRNLQRVYHLQEKLKNSGKKSDFRAQHLHVIGAGVMGGDIAILGALRGLRVSLQDANTAAIAATMKRAGELFKKRLKKSHLVQAALDRLMPDPMGHGVAQADVVIEAIYENLAAKHELLKIVEPQLKPHALLATNTSSLKIEDLSTVLKDPSRLLGIHFFNPVAQMPLVEVVAASATRPELIEHAQAFVRQIDKFPLAVKSAPGFLVNAALGPYMFRAMQMVDDGRSSAEIDAAMRAFGMPVGPLELIDMVGLDVARAAGAGLVAATELPKCLEKLLESGALGRKNGRGFYTWDKQRAQRPTVNVDRTQQKVIQEQLLAPLIQVTQDLVARQIVADAEDADAGMIFGTGFAPHTGGPLNYAKTLAA